MTCLDNLEQECTIIVNSSLWLIRAFVNLSAGPLLPTSRWRNSNRLLRVVDVRRFAPPQLLSILCIRRLMPVTADRSDREGTVGQGVR